MDEEILNNLSINELMILGEVLLDSIDVEKEMLKGEKYDS